MAISIKITINLEKNESATQSLNHMKNRTKMNMMSFAYVLLLCAVLFYYVCSFAQFAGKFTIF